MKEGAENVEKKIQAKVESLKNVNDGTKGEFCCLDCQTKIKMNSVQISEGTETLKKFFPRMEATHVMEVSQLLLSLLHSWGLDPHLDKVCETQLGLLRPMVS